MLESEIISRRQFIKGLGAAGASLALGGADFLSLPVEVTVPEYQRLNLQELSPDLKARATVSNNTLVELGVKPDLTGNGGVLGRIVYSSGNLSPFHMIPLGMVKNVTDRNAILYHPLSNQEEAISSGSIVTSIHADGTETLVDIGIGETVTSLDGLGRLIVVQTPNLLKKVNEDTGQQDFLYQKSGNVYPQRAFTAQSGGLIGLNIVDRSRAGYLVGNIKVWTINGTQRPDIEFNGSIVRGGSQDNISYQEDSYFGDQSVGGQVLIAVKWNGAKWVGVARAFLPDGLNDKLIGTGIIDNKLAFFTVRQAYQSKTFSYQIYTLDDSGQYQSTALTPDMTGPSDIGAVSEYAQVLQLPGEYPVISGVFVGPSGYEKDLLVSKTYPKTYKTFLPIIKNRVIRSILPKIG